jgi:hypothetical protein
VPSGQNYSRNLSSGLNRTKVLSFCVYQFEDYDKIKKNRLLGEWDDMTIDQKESCPICRGTELVWGDILVTVNAHTGLNRLKTPYPANRVQSKRRTFLIAEDDPRE